MQYRIRSESHNGVGDGLPTTIEVKNMRAAKQKATRGASGDRCHIYIESVDGSEHAERHALDTFGGCCNGGWLPWED